MIYSCSRNRNCGGAKICSTPYSLNPSFDLAKNLAGSPMGGFIFRHRRVFLISLPSQSFGGNIVIFGAIFKLVFYLFGCSYILYMSVLWIYMSPFVVSYLVVNSKQWLNSYIFCILGLKFCTKLLHNAFLDTGSSFFGKLNFFPRDGVRSFMLLRYANEA
jgi:hypothetical protein